MGTPAAIIEKTKTGYRGIYCHNDGDIGWVGTILAEDYTAPKKVTALLDLGDISSLGRNVNPITSTHSFDNPEGTVTVAYCRDRGEEDTEATIGSTIEEIAEIIDHQYLYVFENGKWTVDGRPLDAMLLKLES